MIKCKLCDAIFYNKKAYESHNLLHSPEDLYIKSEEDRKLAVLRYKQNDAMPYELNNLSVI